jgi:oligoribonuclease NrnB/cAMP/cGMP phosphodiesterase (DHH superfamily)
MTCYDVFNGDADGICALQQLRLQFPREAQRVSGLKRDIDLLQRVNAEPGDEITVLDISLDKNRDALADAMATGASVFYADHHYPGDIPESDLLDCHIDVAADTCTSLIINKLLDNAQASWAVVGAFGDNFDQPATELGRSVGLATNDLNALQQLGICLNYNGYGFDIDDLLFHPVDLFERVNPYADPLEFIENENGYAELLAQYKDDMSRAQNAPADSITSAGAVYLLAKQFPDRAHALLVDMGDGHHRVSVRAPYNRKDGADELCRQFPSGGGRKAAAGINALSQDSLARFMEKFNTQFGDV